MNYIILGNKNSYSKILGASIVALFMVMTAMSIVVAQDDPTPPIQSIELGTPRMDDVYNWGGELLDMIGTQTPVWINSSDPESGTKWLYYDLYWNATSPNFLTKYKPSDLNFDAYLRYKNLMSDVLINMDKIDELKNKKAGIGRTMKQLKILYDNTDIDINSFTELYEKYSIKLETIENAIRNLKDLGNNNNVKRKPVKIFKPSQ